MERVPIFVSVGATATPEQEALVRAVEDRLTSEGLLPQTIGRNTFSAKAPLKQVIELLDKSSGAVIIAFERSFFPLGLDKRGGQNEAKLSDVKLPTPWNHIEAAMAYSRGLPLLVLVEEGLKKEGLLEYGYDWSVQSIDLSPSALATAKFNGTLASWKVDVEAKAQASAAAARKSDKSPADLTIGELVSGLKPSQLWALGVALASLVAAAFAAGHFK
jgi:hypothetical protein